LFNFICIFNFITYWLVTSVSTGAVIEDSIRFLAITFLLSIHGFIILVFLYSLQASVDLFVDGRKDIQPQTLSTDSQRFCSGIVARRRIKRFTWKTK